MPATTKRQRASQRLPAAAARQHQSATIASFTRVSKSLGKNESQKESLLPAGETVKLMPTTTPSRKRKASIAAADESSADELPIKRITPSTTSTKSNNARGRGRPPKKSRPEPASRKRARSPSVSDSEQSTINAGALLKRLCLESSPSRDSSPLTAATSFAGSEPDEDFQLGNSSQLPTEILDLIDLHSAFLKTLTLHYAHNGSNVPADLRDLTPNVARAWGKKNVTEADVRICIGVLGSKPPAGSREAHAFFLSDYGRGKICVEIDQAKNLGPFNETKLNELFRKNLERLWAQFTATGASDTTKFITSLPRASITVCDSVIKAAPILAKGQQRLDDLMKGIAAKKLEKAAKPLAAATLTKPDGSKMSLLDRIKFKQLEKAAVPAGLTPEQMERRAALQRVEDTAAMIGMLSRASSGGQGRISFTMAAMLEKLKDSFRMGISREEGAACVRILAKEIAPEWVKIVVIGQRENVVIETDCQLSKSEVERRVQNATARD